MEWEAVDEGVYERALDPVERMYQAIAVPPIAGGAEHAPIVLAIRLGNVDGHDLKKNLRTAWRLLRYAVPCLATTIEAGMRVYRIANADELEAWTKRTFIVQYGVCAHDLFSELGHVSEAMLYYLPQAEEIMLRVPHYMTDGIGAIMAINDLLRLAISPVEVQFGTEWKRLSPSIQLAAEIRAPTEAQRKSTQAKMLDWSSSLPSIGLPLTISGRPPGRSRRLQSTFKINESMMIQCICAVRGISILSAFQAAYIEAARKINLQSVGTNFVSFGVFNLRNYCKKPFSTYMHPFSCYNIGLPMVIKTGEFMTTARAIKEYYDNEKEHPDLLSTLPVLADSLVPIFGARPAVPMSTPTMSNVGIVDRSGLLTEYGSMKVTNFWLSINSLTSYILFLLWEWKGEISFCVNWNEAFYSDEGIEAFVSLTREELFRGLGLDGRM